MVRDYYRNSNRPFSFIPRRCSVMLLPQRRDAGAAVSPRGGGRRRRACLSVRGGSQAG